MSTYGIGTFSGLASGIQWRDMLDQIMKIESARQLTPVQSDAKLQQSRVNEFNRYSDLLTALTDATTAFTDGSTFHTMTASAGASSITGATLLSVAADQTATAGTHQVEVLSLARANVMATASQTSDSAALNLSGTFSLNGKTITVGTTDSLATIRDQINAAGAGVKASVIMVATGDYRLSISSDTMGAAGISYTAETVGASLGIATTISGADAQLNVDGIAVVRQTNTISDAVEGLTLTLQKEEVGTTVSVAVSRDSQATTDTIKAFVDAYNALISYRRQQDSSSAKPLVRDPLIRGSINDIKDVILSPATDASILTYDHLSLVGISLSREGVLEIDQAKMDEALAADPAEVEALFTDVAANLSASATSYNQDATGLIDTKIKSLTETITRLNAKAGEVQDRLDDRMRRMEAEFMAMEEALSRINAQGNWFASQLQALQPPR